MSANVLAVLRLNLEAARVAREQVARWLERVPRTAWYGSAAAFVLLFAYWRLTRRSRHTILAPPSPQDAVPEAMALGRTPSFVEQDKLVADGSPAALPASPMASVAAMGSVPGGMPPSVLGQYASDEKEARLLAFLAQTQYVRSLDQSAYMKLVPLLKSVVLEKGESVVPVAPADPALNSSSSSSSTTTTTGASGAYGPGMYIVRRGKLGVFDKASGVLLTEILRGESIGEYSLIGDIEELAARGEECPTCIALTEVELYYLSRSAFSRFVALYPHEMLKFLRTGISRQWRVATYVLETFLRIPAKSRAEFQGPASAAYVGLSFSEGHDNVSDVHSSISSTPGSHIQQQRQQESPLSDVNRRRTHGDGGDGDDADDSKEDEDEQQGDDGDVDSNDAEEDEDQDPLQAGKSASSLSSPRQELLSSVLSTDGSADEPSLSLTPQSSAELDIDPGYDLAAQVELRVGEMLFNLNDPAPYFYVVLSGRLVSLSEEEDVTAELLPGYVVGGISFFGGTDRGEAIRAEEDSVLFQFSAASFSRVCSEAPALMLNIVRAVARQFAPTLSQAFSLGLKTQWFHSGQVIFKQGDPSDSFFIIISGRVRTVTQRQQETQEHTTFRHEEHPRPSEWTPPLAGRRGGSVAVEVGRGEVLGELSVLVDDDEDMDDDSAGGIGGAGAGIGGEGGEAEAHNATRTFAAVAVRDSRVVRITRTAFMHIVQKHPSALLKLTRLFARNLRRQGSEKERTRAYRASTIAIVGAGGAAGYARPGVGAFALRLSAALSRIGPTLHLTATTFDTLNHEHGLSRKLGTFFEREQASQWITEQEEEHQFTVFEADADATPWTDLCIRHADVVVLVGRSSYRPDPSHVEQVMVWNSHTDYYAAGNDQSAVSFLPRVVDLVILHPASAERPVHTIRWLRGRPTLRSFHHVRSGIDGDYERFARHLAGLSVGLVLGGGGARGLAHIGVLRALHEERIPIDMISGSSQGAFMGALYSRYMDIDVIRRKCREFANIFKWWRLLMGLTLPILSYFHGGEFTKAIQIALGHHGGDNQYLGVEDFWLRYFCVSTNITTNDLSVHHLGCAWRYVRASMSVLGLLPPVIDDDNNDVLIDGGYVNNLPVDVMHLWGHPQTIIACDVEDKDNSFFSNIVNYGCSVSGWWLLLQKLFSKNVINISQIMLWLTSINNSRQLRVNRAEMIDIYIRPAIEGFALMDYHRQDELEELGYRAAKKAISSWKLEREAERLAFLASRLNKRSPPTILPHVAHVGHHPVGRSSSVTDALTGVAAGADPVRDVLGLAVGAHSAPTSPKAPFKARKTRRNASGRMVRNMSRAALHAVTFLDSAAAEECEAEDRHSFTSMSMVRPSLLRRSSASEVE